MDERVSLVSIANGAALELFERELSSVLANIQDVNTAPRSKREITIRIAFKADESRERADVQVEVKSKLAGVRPVDREIFLGKQDGENVAVQSNPRQGRIFDPVPSATDLKEVEKKVRDANAGQ